MFIKAGRTLDQLKSEPTSPHTTRSALFSHTASAPLRTECLSSSRVQLSLIHISVKVVSVAKCACAEAGVVHHMLPSVIAVSYTHLDVYKRQDVYSNRPVQ